VMTAKKRVPNLPISSHNECQSRSAHHSMALLTVLTAERERRIWICVEHI
jgi:hypothetical protein